MVCALPHTCLYAFGGCSVDPIFKSNLGLYRTYFSPSKRIASINDLTLGPLSKMHSVVHGHNLIFLGKCELYHWIDILDLCDDILEQVTEKLEIKLETEKNIF